MDQKNIESNCISKCPYCLKDFKKSDWYSLQISPPSSSSIDQLNLLQELEKEQEKENSQEGEDWYMTYLIEQINQEYKDILKIYLCSAKCMRDYCSENPSICRPI